MTSGSSMMMDDFFRNNRRYDVARDVATDEAHAVAFGDLIAVARQRAFEKAYAALDQARARVAAILDNVIAGGLKPGLHQTLCKCSTGQSRADDASGDAA